MQIIVSRINFNGNQTQTQHRKGSRKSFQRVILNVFIFQISNKFYLIYFYFNFVERTLNKNEIKIIHSFMTILS